MKQRSRWKLVWFLTLKLQLALASSVEDDYRRNRNVPKSLFSPRMDYNQWKPLGRGDPLKNDPTFDYVPPVLDQVHYWVDPEPHTPSNVEGENSKKTEILLLGVSSKKPATIHQTSINANDRRDTVYEPFFEDHEDKSTDYYNNNQRISRPNFFPSMTSQIIPSLMSLANEVFDRKSVFSKAKESKVPYTVLMPPPLDHNTGHFSPTTPMSNEKIPDGFEPFTPILPNSQYFSTPTPSNGVTVQESNLIYQSSSHGYQKEFESVPSISWELPSTSTESNKNNFMSYNQDLSPPKSFIRIQFSNNQNYSNKILEPADSNHNINYVTPPPLDYNKMTFKGHVSDDNHISDSYVKIEKPQAQMDHGGIEINNINSLPITLPFGDANYDDISMETIKDMETIKPPPVTQSPVYSRPTNPVANILKKEQVKPDRLEFTNFIGSSSSIASSFVTIPRTETSMKVDTTTSETSTTDYTDETTTILPLPTTTATLATILTTTETRTTIKPLSTADPLLKQPPSVEIHTFRGSPMYHIIQGHSKVKTYKPAKQIDGVMVQETNEIPYLNYRNVDHTIKHLHGYEKKEDLLKKAENIAKQRQARTGNLQTLKHLVLTGLGAIDFSNEEAELRKRSNEDLEETELEVGYEVVDSKDFTSEKYRKGIVEAARKLNV